jgi:hypothetical protein
MTETDASTTEGWKAARQEELDAEAIYRALAAAQASPERAELLAGIADDERRHAAHWEERLRAAGVDPGPAAPGHRARILCRLAGSFGDTVVVPIMRDREALSTEAYMDESGAFAADEERPARARSRRSSATHVASRSVVHSHACSAAVPQVATPCAPPSSGSTTAWSRTRAS